MRGRENTPLIRVCFHNNRASSSSLFKEQTTTQHIGTASQTISNHQLPRRVRVDLHPPRKYTHAYTLACTICLSNEEHPKSLAAPTPPVADSAPFEPQPAAARTLSLPSGFRTIIPAQVEIAAGPHSFTIPVRQSIARRLQKIRCGVTR